MSEYRKLLHRDVIPPYYIERGILGGYRPPGITIKQSLLSIFSINNETFNVWTHLLALFYNFWYIQQVCNSKTMNDLSADEKAPLLCYMAALCVYPSGSVIAHIFNSMSEFSRHFSFMIDYLGICIYAFCTALAVIAYAFPPEWRNSTFEQLFIVVNFISASLAICLTCKSRFWAFSIYTQILRFLGFVLPYFTSMSVLVYRLMYTSGSEATLHYFHHFATAFSFSVFYISHFPECLFPGAFDIYLHSHQIFHVLVGVATHHKLFGLEMDIANKYSLAAIPNCIHLMGCFILFGSVITGYYIYHKYQEIYRRRNAIVQFPAKYKWNKTEKILQSQTTKLCYSLFFQIMLFLKIQHLNISAGTSLTL